ncbi:hypothetical protein HAD_12989 [Hyphomonas adhaerens MHS-3]|uniref:Helix-turn-helix domain-containing protein n=1 Tax=Hyphomonas adhaerens MHS-3 TaxID=1280949 RepID=A0A069E244_9PROT|nr:helix-turn-helix domain-containing protein [Hyphomonas adhaerens]KCZ83520.1 hypothetical protein HAD_12989 [Hyphomonas adhaerens MHS-3]
MSKKKSGYLFLRLAFQVEGLRGPYRAIFLELCSYADASGFCFPTMKRIAQRTHYSIKTVDRAISELEDLGLIRRKRRSANGNRRGYDFAIALPIGLLVSKGRQGVSQNTDAESGRNYPSKLSKELAGTGQADVQNLIWKELSPFIDPQSHKSMFSLFPVIEFLLGKPDEEAVQMVRRLPLVTKRLKHRLQASHEKLTSWEPLIELLSHSNGTSDKASGTESQSATCPICEALSVCMVESGAPEMRARTLVERLNAHELSDKIEITSDVAARIATLQTGHGSALNRLATGQNKPVVLVQNGSTIARYVPR